VALWQTGNSAKPEMRLPVGKRPSLAETMRQVAVAPELERAKPAPVTLVAATTPEPALTSGASAARPYFAATRVGKKKVTAALSPAAHKQLKSLAVDHETKSEALLAEAIRDLFSKYGKPAID
jgi:hypothetical protein